MPTTRLCTVAKRPVAGVQGHFTRVHRPIEDGIGLCETGKGSVVGVIGLCTAGKGSVVAVIGLCETVHRPIVDETGMIRIFTEGWAAAVAPEPAEFPPLARLAGEGQPRKRRGEGDFPTIPLSPPTARRSGSLPSPPYTSGQTRGGLTEKSPSGTSPITARS